MASQRPARSARRSGPAPAGVEVRERILAATTALLGERRFESISVADILTAAEISRASFYFYFPSKQAVLAELVRNAVQAGQQAAQPFLDATRDPIAGLRSGIRDGAALWRDNAGVLMAIVESWGADEGLRALWMAQMDLFNQATVRRIEADPQASQRLRGTDIRAVAASLTWLGERLYYLAAAGVPPFDDEDVLVDTMLTAWTSILYGDMPAKTRTRRSL
jgi:AcrR family transcriptional regulator